MAFQIGERVAVEGAAIRELRSMGKGHWPDFVEVMARGSVDLHAGWIGYAGWALRCSAFKLLHKFYP